MSWVDHEYDERFRRSEPDWVLRDYECATTEKNPAPEFEPVWGDEDGDEIPPPLHLPVDPAHQKAYDDAMEVLNKAVKEINGSKPKARQTYHYDRGKPVMTYAPHFRREVGNVFAAARAEKYPDVDGVANWWYFRKKWNWRQLAESVIRHMNAFLRGEDEDPEWGLHALAHAGCDLDMLGELVLTGHGNDDRDRWAAEEDGYESEYE